MLLIKYIMRIMEQYNSPNHYNNNNNFTNNNNKI